MYNPFNLPDEKLLELLSGYKFWLDSNPNEALAKFQELFGQLGKKVIPVNSRSIAKGGGVLNCITCN
ncbi:MAG TPA: hypothetical protein PLR88_10605 [Bacteroidales bacterium]|nr:hypothetical protein [Bacteroidales bacterium]